MDLLLQCFAGVPWSDGTTSGKAELKPARTKGKHSVHWAVDLFFPCSQDYISVNKDVNLPMLWSASAKDNYTQKLQ